MDTINIKNEISSIIKSAGFEYIGEIDVDKIEYHSELRDMCEMNTCGRYGNTWNCPPVIGTLEQLSGECKSYSNGYIFSFVHELEDSFDFEGMAEAGSELCRKLCKLEEIILSDKNDSQNSENAQTINKFGIASYKIYGSGACFSCEKCSYPDNPCIHPEMCFIPIEACGIYVTKLAQGSGLSYNNGQNTVTFFGMLMYNVE